MLEIPAFVEMCCGDLAREAELSLIKAAAGDNLAFKEGLIKKMEMLRKEVAGPSPTPLRRLTSAS
jgi:hypothetical protein